MKLKLFIDIFNRKLVTSATSDLPVSLPDFFREDHVELEIQLLEPTGSMTSPLSIVDNASLSLQAAIGNPGSDPDALQTTFTKDTVNKKWTGTINLQTTEMVAAFTAAGASIERYLEIEVEGTSTQYHTVLQQLITLHRDIITHPLVDPEDVTSGSAFANSFAATAENSTTVEWTAAGNYNYAHVKGMSGASSLTAGKFIKVNSGGTGFEETDISLNATSIDALSDVDTSTAAPSSGDHLKWDGSNWIPETHSIDKLTDVDTSTSAPSSNEVLTWDGSNWIPAAAQTATQNLWATVAGDSGSTVANSVTDSLTVAGGQGIDTTVSADTLTIAGELSTATNIGMASFSDDDFTVSTGHVSTKAVGLAKGGTGATNKQDAFDNLSPLTSAGDILTHDGSDNIRLAIGSASQHLAVNSGGTALEWVAPPSGGSGDMTGVDLTAGTGISIDSETNTTSGDYSATITCTVTDTNTTYTAGDGLDLTSTTFSLDLKSAGGLAIDSTEAKVDVNNLTDLTNTTFGTANFGAGDHIAVADASDSNATKRVKMPAELVVAVTDETTAISAGVNALTFRMPHAMTLTEVRANVKTAPTGSAITVDINESGSTILSTKLTIDATEKTSVTAATPAAISDTALADDAEITVDLDTVGSTLSGVGLKLALIGYR